MAKRNVIREDVVQVSWDVIDDDLIKAQRETKEFVKETSGGMKEAVKDVKRGTDNINKGFRSVQGELRDTSRQSRTLKQAFDKMVSSKVKRLPEKFKELTQKIRESKKESDNLKGSFDGLASKVGTIAGALGVATGAGAVVNGAVNQAQAGNKLQAMTGANDKEMADMKKSMENLYVGNLGKDFADIATSMADVRNQTQLTGKALEDLTGNALLLRDTYDFDVKESVRTADMMMKQFGIDGDRAYDLIAQGAQMGLDKNGNLLDSMNEYAVHFKQIGFGAEDMVGMFKNAADQGVFDIDKIGDAVKEFGIRAVDGSDSTAKGFEALGLDAGKMAQKFKAGGETGKEAFKETLQALNEMKDPVAREAAGVALFGTMWEDLGSKAVLAMSKSTTGITEGTQALDKINQVQYDDALSALQSLGRQVNTSLAGPINQVMPAIKSAIGWVRENLAAVSIAIGSLIGLMILGKVSTLGFVGAVKAFTVATKIAKVAQLAWQGVMVVFKGIMAAARVAQLLFNAALWANPITWVVVAVLALIAVVILLVKNWDTVKAKILAIWGALKQGAANLRDSIVEKIKGIITKIANFKDEMKQKGKDLLDGFINGIKSKFDGLKKIGSSIKDKVMGGLKWFKFGSPSKRMAQYGKWTMQGYTNAVKDSASGLKKTIDKSVAKPFKTTAVIQGENDYTPSATSYSKTSNSETNYFNPQFSLTVASSGDRDTERKVKQWVKEAIQDTIDSMNRRSGRLTEV